MLVDAAAADTWFIRHARLHLWQADGNDDRDIDLRAAHSDGWNSGSVLQELVPAL